MEVPFSTIPLNLRIRFYALKSASNETFNAGEQILIFHGEFCIFHPPQMPSRADFSHDPGIDNGITLA